MKDFIGAQFKLSGRLGRLSYLLRILIIKTLAGLFFLGWFNVGLPFYDLWMIPSIAVLLLTWVLAYCYTVRRLNDLNQIGLLVGLLIFVPALGSFLLAVPLLIFRGSPETGRRFT
jgi:uncharacterized membrane protein YhaH (DUF805 family)